MFREGVKIEAYLISIYNIIVNVLDWRLKVGL